MIDRTRTCRLREESGASRKEKSFVLLRRNQHACTAVHTHRRAYSALTQLLLSRVAGACWVQVAFFDSSRFPLERFLGVGFPGCALTTHTLERFLGVGFPRCALTTHTPAYIRTACAVGHYPRQTPVVGMKTSGLIETNEKS